MRVLLLILKLILVPLLVGAMSWVARLWGPAIGGLIMGLPWMTGPVLYFFALERGEAYAARMTIGIELGVATIAAWVLGYTTVAGLDLRAGVEPGARPVAGWPWSLAAACAAFAAVGVMLDRAGPAISSTGYALPIAAAIGYASLVGGAWLIPIPPTPPGPRLLPWWDIPVRMLATAVIVAAISASAAIVGSTASGIIATFPVIGIVVGSFTHHRWGAGSAIRLLRSLLLSLVSFATFFVIVGATIESWGASASFMAAALIALCVSAGMIGLTRRGLLKT